MNGEMMEKYLDEGYEDALKDMAERDGKHHP
jgi:hypothetical protein